MTPRLLAFLLLGMMLAGCSSVSSRIDRNRAGFERYSMAVREKIVAGEVGVGFTPDQVRMALGEPDRVSTRTTPDGSSEVWSYRAKKPRFAIGVGVGVIGGGGSKRVGTGVGVGTGDRFDDERMRVVFERGEVAAVDVSRKQALSEELIVSCAGEQRFDPWQHGASGAQEFFGQRGDVTVQVAVEHLFALREGVFLENLADNKAVGAPCPVDPVKGTVDAEFTG